MKPKMTRPFRMMRIATSSSAAETGEISPAGRHNEKGLPSLRPKQIV